MWTRAQLKERGKISFRANYWKAVLMALVLSLILGGAAFSGVPGVSSMGTGAFGGMVGALEDADVVYDEGINAEDLDESADPEILLDDALDGATEGMSDEEIEALEEELDSLDFSSEDGDSVHIGEDGIEINSSDGDSVYIGENGVTVEESDGTTHDYGYSDVVIEDEELSAATVLAGIAIAFGVLLLVIVALAIGFAISAFFLDPIEIGARRFFLTNLNRKAEVKEIAFAFDHCYLNNVKTMFLRDIFIFLWSLLFIIPGIVKSYEYRMIPYIIAENPEMDYKTAFAQSKQMMSGQKWNTFVLDLSFIGWWLLSLITCGIVGIFYVDPYYNATCAALYETLRYGQPAPAPQQPVAPYAPVAPTAQAAAPDMTGQPSWATAQPVTPAAPVATAEPAAPAEPVQVTAEVSDPTGPIEPVDPADPPQLP